jgi:hypothetical protein
VALERSRPLVRAVPAWAWVAAVVVVSAGVRYALGRRIVAPWIMVDELVYSELAKSFAATGHFLIRGHSTAAYGFVYPLLVSPAWRLFASIPQAYAAAKAIDAVLMSLAAVPAYLLARRLLGQAAAVVAAAFAVLLPSLAYTGTLMTENAFYPLFLTAVLLLVLVLERPTVLRQLALLGVCAVAYLTRAQALALVAALATAPLLLAAIEGARPRSLWRYRVLYGALGGALLLAVAYEGVRGRSPLALLGAYRVTSEQGYSAGEVARWLLYHVAELDLYIGIVPFAALLLLAGRARVLPRKVQAFVAASLAVSGWLLLEVATFATKFAEGRVEERNTFYLAPLFLIALLVHVRAGLPRPRVLAAAAALAAGLLPLALPFTRLIGLNSTSDTLALLPWWRLQDHLIRLDQVRLVATLCALAAAALWLLLPARWAAVLPALVALYFVAVAIPVNDAVHGFRFASLNSLFGGITAPHVDWIDRAVGHDAEVAALWTGRVDRHVIWENEFFNRSIGPVYYLHTPLGGGLPETALSVDRATGLMRGPDGRPVRARYLLVDGSVTPDGVPVAEDLRKGVTLYRLIGPLRSTTRVTGVYDDTWSGPLVLYTRLACRGGTLTVTVQGDPGLFSRPSTLVARIGGAVVARATIPQLGVHRVRVPLVPVHGRCETYFLISPTKVPGASDGRRLGLHFSGFAYAPPG